MKSELAKSSISGVIQFIVGLFLVLVTIPVFVRTLGTEAYGLFSLIALVGSLNTIVNLGLNSALVRFLAEQGKTAESDMDIVVTLAILLVVLGPATLCGIFFQKLILVQILNVPSYLLDDAQWLFLSVLLANALILTGQTFTAILDSQQKVYLTNLFQMIYNIMYWGLILLVVLLGYSLRAVAVATLASTAIWFCLVLISAVRSWGRLSLNGLGDNGARLVRKQLSYSLQIYSAGLIYVLFEPLSKILVSHLVGVAEVGIYDIGLRVRNQVYGLITKVLYPLFPLISKLTDHERIRNIVHDVEQKTFYVVMPLIGMFLLMSGPLVNIFFRSNTEAISVTIAFIVPGYLLGSSTVTPMYQFLLVKGHASKTILIQFVNAFVNGMFVLLFYSYLGYYVIVVGNTLAIGASFSLLLYYQHKYLKSLVFDTLKQALAMFFTFLAAIILGFVADGLVGLNSWKLIAGPVVVLFITACLYRYFRLIKTTDVIRYLGESNAVSRFVMFVLCIPEQSRVAQT